MANPANYAISLGLLIAVLAAILAATRRTPAIAGAALPILAAAGGRQPSRRTGTGRATARKGTAKVNGTGKANGTKANGNGKATRADTRQTTAAPTRTRPAGAKAEPSAAPAVNPVSGTQRLAPGKLQEQVLAYLAQHAGQELSPSHIAKALGRSSGAVGNGLESLAKDGEVQKTRETPRRFMIPARATAKRNGNGQPAAPAAPKPTRATRSTRKAGNGPTTGNGGNGKGNGGNDAKAEPPATPDRASKAPAAKPTERKPATRRGRNNKAGAAADEAAATGT